MKCPLCGREFELDEHGGQAEATYSDLMGEGHCWDCHEDHYLELIEATRHMEDFTPPISRRRPRVP